MNSISTVFTESSIENDIIKQSGLVELLSILPMIEKTGRGYARQRYKQADFMFVEECIAEGWFVVTQMIIEHYAEILEEYPEEEKRFKFYRMATKFRLGKYWHRYKLPESLQKFADVDVSYTDTTIETLEIEEEWTELERLVVDYRHQGNSNELIAQKVGLSVKSVAKIFSRLKRRLGWKKVKIIN